MDQMILTVQKYLNKTYAGTPGFPIHEDGKTGWATTNALLVALQKEEKVPEWAIETEVKNGTYGFRGMTVANCPTVGTGYTNSRVVYILQGAFWCKGINPFAFDGKFTEATTNAIKKLQGDAGIPVTGVAHVLEFKALLSMDQFTLIGKGDSRIRSIQQSLNRIYAQSRGVVIPCDGIYGAGLNKSLVYALQRIEGFSVDVANKANGYFGGGTADKCPTLSYGSKQSEFVELLQWCLYCNGCNPGGFTGIFDSNTQSAVELFQKELALPGTPGVADINVWESLLISCGNKNRSAKALDTATTLTYESAKGLKNAGYEVVGRYLTNKFAMTKTEINNITRAGLDIFAIYEYGNSVKYFETEGRGYMDAEEAKKAALNLGIPAQTVIYFAVDYDMMDYQVDEIIIPYFKQISDSIQPYKVGIYGSRNICSKVSKAGLAVSSFVLDMSTGYSGNLGFTMPSNWHFDQFATVTVAGVEIDKDAYKPANGLQITFNKIDNNVEETQLDEILNDIDELYKLAQKFGSYNQRNNFKACNLFVLKYLRHIGYNSFKWLLTLGFSNPGEFPDFVAKQNPTLDASMKKYISSNETLIMLGQSLIGIPHLAVTAEGYSEFTTTPKYWTGWGGDMATLTEEVELAKKNGQDPVVTANTHLANIYASESSFDLANFYEDIDAIYFANHLNENTFGNLLRQYYLNGGCSNRAAIFRNSIGVGSNNEISSKAYDMLTGIEGLLYPLAGYKLEGLMLNKDKGINVVDKDCLKIACNALQDKIGELTNGYLV